MILCLLVWCQLSPDEVAWVRTMSLPPLPANPSNRVADDEQAAALGDLFFNAKDVAPGKMIACASCHPAETAFTDGLETSQGITRLTRNAPSLFLVAHQRWYFWDGRADSLWAQAIQPIEDPREMGLDRSQLGPWLAADSQRKRIYETVFGPLTYGDREADTQVLVNLAKSVEAFERTIQAPKRPWDQFVADVSAHGQSDVLNSDQLAGLRLFRGKALCATCHSGPLFSDLEFHDTRLPQPTPSPEPGRFEGVKRVKTDPFNQAGEYSDDRNTTMARWVNGLSPNVLQVGSFKTPTLRYVALTAPYMHDGSMANLRSVVNFYNELEHARPSHHPEPLLQPIHLSEPELAQLIAFLESL
ncbi:MAG: hypothetical protein KDC71_21475 [Acidobacteria bacterium]|nr:hypothetical protein [Acidobacteriota bacterium]